MRTDQTGPGLSAAEIRAIAPSLPDSMVAHLVKQRVNAERVYRVAADYATRLYNQTRNIRDARHQAEQKQPSAVTTWDSEVDRLVARGMTEPAAVRKLAVEQPSLHAAMLAAVNAPRRAG